VKQNVNSLTIIISKRKKSGYNITEKNVDKNEQAHG